jgi:hypothetical protein
MKISIVFILSLVLGSLGQAAFAQNDSRIIQFTNVKKSGYVKQEYQGDMLFKLNDYVESEYSSFSYVSPENVLIYLLRSTEESIKSTLDDYFDNSVSVAGEEKKELVASLKVFSEKEFVKILYRIETHQRMLLVFELSTDKGVKSEKRIAAFSKPHNYIDTSISSDELRRWLEL